MDLFFCILGFSAVQKLSVQMNKDVISPRTFVSVSCLQFWFILSATVLGAVDQYSSYYVVSVYCK